MYRKIGLLAFSLFLVPSQSIAANSDPTLDYQVGVSLTDGMNPGPGGSDSFRGLEFRTLTINRSDNDGRTSTASVTITGTPLPSILASSFSSLSNNEAIVGFARAQSSGALSYQYTVSAASSVAADALESAIANFALNDRAGRQVGVSLAGIINFVRDNSASSASTRISSGGFFINGQCDMGGFACQVSGDGVNGFFNETLQGAYSFNLPGGLRRIAGTQFFSGDINLSADVFTVANTGPRGFRQVFASAFIDPQISLYQLFNLNASDYQISLSPGIGNGEIPGVPEPATWLLMIIGFGFAGAVIRRSKARERLDLSQRTRGHTRMGVLSHC